MVGKFQFHKKLIDSRENSVKFIAYQRLSEVVNVCKMFVTDYGNPAESGAEMPQTRTFSLPPSFKPPIEVTLQELAKSFETSEWYRFKKRKAKKTRPERQWVTWYIPFRDNVT